MPDAPPNPELMRSLARLVRGLSALFWGLPAALIVCCGTAMSGWFKALWIVPPLAVTGLLLFGLGEMESFQKQERPWRAALDRARFFALIEFGLSPFLYWWHEIPENRFFTFVLCLFAVSALVLLFELNLVLLRLGAMLPDETLRHETRQFTALNRILLALLLLLISLSVYFFRASELPTQFSSETWRWFEWGSRVLLIFFGLLPLAMTMALLWKAKEVIIESVFGGRSQ
jgi:hypothetical protein